MRGASSRVRGASSMMRGLMALRVCATCPDRPLPLPHPFCTPSDITRTRAAAGPATNVATITIRGCLDTAARERLGGKITISSHL
eukprot:3285457-Pleurochrysis_carterae.AAC.2